jgi:hypothetical protein
MSIYQVIAAAVGLTISASLAQSYEQDIAFAQSTAAKVSCQNTYGNAWIEHGNDVSYDLTPTSC